MRGRRYGFDAAPAAAGGRCGKGMHVYTQERPDVCGRCGRRIARRHRKGHCLTYDCAQTHPCICVCASCKAARAGDRRARKTELQRARRRRERVRKFKVELRGTVRKVGRTIARAARRVRPAAGGR